MLGATYVLGLASGSKTLPLVNQADPYTGVYFLREALQSYEVTVRHAKANRNGVQYDRHNVQAVVTIFATSTVPESKRTAYFVMEQLPSDTNVELMDALSDWAIASSNANLVKVLGWES